ncbi:hypothetical protein [Methylobacterium sp. Leaf85]|uniref:hypothetical protein n=1 Tax=Methylobacterium sp. Leaf85 TaxID=1736241 RepID=UPI0006F98D7C|nr:hypothetical protein [Methylobacterium sp. Leaf85]KQO43011.1 hypothetical protein ASF08_10560 [Methylobacterium sp. Leaf85]
MTMPADLDAVERALGETVAASAATLGYPITFGFWHHRWRTGQREEVLAWISEREMDRPQILEIFPLVFVSLRDGGDAAFEFKMRWS